MPLRPFEIPTVRAASLRGLERLARQFKVDEVALMRQVGLSPRQLADPESRISVQAGCELLEAFAQHSGREDVGLLMAQSRRLSNLGTSGLVTALQSDLRHALQQLVALRGDFNAGLMLALEEHAGIAVMRLEYVVPGVPYARQAIEQATGVLVEIIRQFLGEDWTPRRVCFRHPPPADMRTHRRILGWAVEFEHDFNAVVLTSQDLDTVAPLHDPALAEVAARGATVRARGLTYTQSCREHLTVLLPLGQASIDQVAARMGLQRRSLQRRLDAEGLTFSDVLQRLREELLQTHLEDGRLPLSELAIRLGFSAPSVFSRWHRATFGRAARTRYLR